jgi:hypothetical protein
MLQIPPVNPHLFGYCLSFARLPHLISLSLGALTSFHSSAGSKSNRTYLLLKNPPEP